MTEKTLTLKSSDRTFGLLFSVLFLLVAFIPALRGHEPRLWALAPSLALLLFAWLAPAKLHPLHRGWIRLGLLLNRFVNPLVLGILFYGFVTPLALVMRAFGTDFLRLKLDAKAPSYWILREPKTATFESLARQF